MTNPDDGLYTYQWEFGDGSFADGIKVTHTYSQYLPSYRASFMYSDKSGAGVSTWVPVVFDPTAQPTAISEAYVDNAWDSVVGAPTSLETAVSTRKIQFFEKGVLYQRANNDVIAVSGEIYAKWLVLKAQNGFLGYPTSQMYYLSNGGRWNSFQGGAVYSAGNYGPAYEIHGPIRDKWNSLGQYNSTIGYPTSDVYATSAGFRSDFQHGSIELNSASGVVTVSNK
jgi:hypothetical protein